MDYINDNGKLTKKENWQLSPDNRSFRYGDGCFETIQLINGRIVLAAYHFERLFASLETLKFINPRSFTPQKLAHQIIEVASKNKHKHARVRLTIYRGDGGLYDEVNHVPNYLIQTWELNDSINQLNENGLIVDFFLEARKACDSFSSIKSNNFLCYAMGALWAKQQKLNDCIVLNSFDKVADATIANVFIVKDGTICTPPLTDGAINGVMRRHILKCIKDEGMPYREMSLTTEDVLQASEVFFTNAISGIRWVKQVGKSNYQNQVSAFLHTKIVAPLFK
jgi:branched-chain amino acid aminotransferase